MNKMRKKLCSSNYHLHHSCSTGFSLAFLVGWFVVEQMSQALPGVNIPGPQETQGHRDTTRPKLLIYVFQAQEKLRKEIGQWF